MTDTRPPIWKPFLEPLQKKPEATERMRPSPLSEMEVQGYLASARPSKDCRSVAVLTGFEGDKEGEGERQRGG